MKTTVNPYILVEQGLFRLSVSPKICGFTQFGSEQAMKDEHGNTLIFEPELLPVLAAMMIEAESRLKAFTPLVVDTDDKAKSKEGV